MAQRVCDAEIARELGRSVSAVRQQRLAALGIRRYRPAAKRPPGAALTGGAAGRRVWTEEEDRALLDCPARYGETRDLARDLGRGARACYERRRALLRSMIPPVEELEDAIARWGVEGAAEEYNVSQTTIKRWRKTLTGQDQEDV